MTKSCDIYIAITTYNRPQDFHDLMEDVSRETQGKNVHIHVYDDSSDQYYHDSKKYDLTVYKNNHGKQGYWSIMNDVFRDAQTWNFKYFFFLQDDCRLIEGFFERAVEEFEAIQDKEKATLCTFTPENIYQRTMWAGQSAKDVEYNKRLFITCGYVDCIFMCPQKTLKDLEYKVDPISPNRFKDKFISSGVGQQLSLRLLRMRKTMYCAWSSLIVGHSNDSKMNQQERVRNPMKPLLRQKEQPIELSKILSFKKEHVTVGIASLQNREESLKKTIQSLRDQVDEIHVYLNDYEKVPDFVQNDPKITFYMGKIHRDRGDTGKYFSVANIENGYYFSCDDDLIYPHDYVEKSINYLKSLQNKAIISYHGVLLHNGTLENYYKNRIQIHYANFQRHGRKVHIGGTGVMAFHVKTFKPDIKKFLYPNMSDIWVGIQAQEQQIPIICAPRPLNWIKADEIPIKETIYGSKKNHQTQTDVLNRWKEKHGEFILY